jgi:SAM-dependent methyltransferase
MPIVDLERLKTRLRHTWIFPRHIDRRFMHPIIAQAALGVRGTLLDVGCGKRQYEYLFSGTVSRYIGLDWPSKVESANADVIGDALAIPFAEASVDCVLSTELMEHVPDPHVLLTEIARVLRSGGTLILSAPLIVGLHEEPRDYYRFTPYILRILLAKHGFAVQSLSGKGGWWSVVLGSFVVQALYDWANPANEVIPGANGDGPRDYSRFRRSNGNLLALALVLPVCAVFQMIAYGMDRLFESPRYSAGHVVVATRNTRGLPGEAQPDAAIESKRSTEAP